MKYQYAKNRIQDAIDELCVGTGDVRSRLLEVNDLTSSLLPIHFPEELLEKWNNIQKKLSKYGPRLNFEGKPVEGAITHTLSRIKNKTGSEIANDLLALNKEFQSKY
nr:hypothetical protein [Moritella viscosa]SHO17747.1 Putative uncharacterized protein [Moritella viscosa]